MVTETHGASADGRGGSGSGRPRRTTPALFYRQVVAELRKVLWPTRHELTTYTIVVMVFVVIMVGIVFGLDYGFHEAVNKVFG